MNAIASPDPALWLLTAVICCVAGPLAAGVETPVPVSPGDASAGSITEARCPTFSWGGVAGAPGYELAVFRLPGDAAGEPVLVTRVSLPANSRAWTPSVGQCLERGERYAWSVAARDADVGEGELEWALPFLFEVEPSAASALESPVSEPVRWRPAIAAAGDLEGLGTDREADVGGAREPAAASVRRRSAEPPMANPAPGDLASAAVGVSRIESAASAPSLGTASLAVSSQIHLAAGSDLFKDGQVFLWDDASGNVALGRSALSSVSGSANNNTALGSGALQNTTGGAPFHGSDNTAVGRLAMQANTTGRANTAVGAAALVSNTTGYLNTATGVHALLSNSTGRSNTGTGAFSLGSNTTGSLNTADGAYALHANTNGSFNTAAGVSALRANTTGEENTAVGVLALRYNTGGSFNTAVGTLALSKNTTGVGNTATGQNALRSNTTGIGNTADGIRALELNTTGIRNTASGLNALLSNTIGGSNTASGAYVLFANTSGNLNTASGHYTLSANTTGSYNTAVGAHALQASTTGHRNVAIGMSAGNSLATGYRNVIIGFDADVSPGVHRSIVIGATANASGNRQIKIGHYAIHYGGTSIAGIHGATVDSVTDAPVLVDSQGRLGTGVSSRRFKQDIENVGDLAGRLLELRPVAFRYKEHVAENPNAPRSFGLIAEEVAEVLPELVVFDEKGKPQTVKYHLLGSLLLGTLQEQHGLLEEQRRRAERHEAENARLRARLAAIEARLDRLPRRDAARSSLGSR